MTRDLAADLSAEVGKRVLYPFFALHVDLPDPVYAWSGVGTLTFNGHDWLGVGGFGGFGAIEETGDGTASQMAFSLSGIEPSFYTYLIEQPYRNALVELWIGALNDMMTQVSAGPNPLYRGRLVAADLTDGDQLAIQVTAERSSRDQTRQRVRRYTDAEQQRRYPGDKFFEYQAQMQSVQVLWGREG